MISCNTEGALYRVISTLFMKVQRVCGTVTKVAIFSFPEMLNPSSHVQKDSSEEDSSGSDAGLEPETDRFGFIVTGGSTAG